MENYRKHLGLWTEAQQRRLCSADIAVGGVGGVGAAVALLLAKSGVGRIRIADRDTYEPNNIVEQAFATWDAVGKPKVDVASAEIQRHQAGLKVDPICGDLTNPSFAKRLVKRAGLLFSAVDNPDARIELGRAALMEGIPFVVAGNVGWSVFHTVYTPDRGGYAAAFETMKGIRKDGQGFPVMSDQVTRTIVTQAWCIWTVAFSGYSREALHRFIRGDISSYPYMAGSAFLAASLAVTNGIRHIIGMGWQFEYPHVQVIDLKHGTQLDRVEIQKRYNRVASKWNDGDQAVMAAILKGK